MPGLWKKILAFFFAPNTLTGREWYQHLAFYFNPPKAHATWIVKRDKLEIHWQQASLNLPEAMERQHSVS